VQLLCGRTWNAAVFPRRHLRITLSTCRLFASASGRSCANGIALECFLVRSSLHGRRSFPLVRPEAPAAFTELDPFIQGLTHKLALALVSNAKGADMELFSSMYSALAAAVADAWSIAAEGQPPEAGADPA
jgi:hypothetical protein